MPDNAREKRIYELLQKKSASGGQLSKKESRIFELMNKKYGQPALTTPAAQQEQSQPGVGQRVMDYLKQTAEVALPTTTRFIAGDAPEEAYEHNIVRRNVESGGRLAQDVLTLPDRFAGSFRGQDPTNIQTTLMRPEAEKVREAAAEKQGPMKYVLGNVATGLEMLGPDMIYGAAKKPVSEAVQAAGRFGNKALGKLATELSNVSEPALRKFGLGLGKGAKELKKAAGTERAIGERVLNAINDFDRFLPERRAIDNALDNMQPVNAQRIIDVLETSKTGGKKGARLAQTQKSNEQINQMISDVRAAMDQSGNIPAREAFDLRREIDAVVGDAIGKESGAFLTAGKRARHALKEALLESAESSGNQEYIGAMQTLARKMTLADDIKGYIGKSQKAQERRIERFVSNLFGKNSEDKQRLLSQIGDLFGEDFLRESELARMAFELGPGGKPALTPRIFTGRSLLGGGFGAMVGGPGGAAAGMALSSPRIAAGTLGTADLTGEAVKGVGRGVDALLGPAVRTSLPRGVGAQTTRVINPEEEEQRKQVLRRMGRQVQQP